jgi:hypothetical protein
MAAERAEHFTELEGYKNTDMQFNIGRVEGGPTRGYDLIDPVTKNRVYVTGPSDENSEDMVRAALGEHSVLEPTERTSDYTVYAVPHGSLLLEKTLQQGPYRIPYMQKLAVRSFLFMEGLNKLDPHAFGIDGNSIALTHNGEAEEDDVHLTVVPPLLAATSKERNANNLEAIRRHYLANKLGAVTLNTLKKRSQQGDNNLQDFDLTSMLKYFTVEKGEDK